MELEISLPGWALDALDKEAEIVKLDACDLALLFIAQKVEHTQPETDAESTRSEIEES